MQQGITCLETGHMLIHEGIECDQHPGHLVKMFCIWDMLGQDCQGQVACSCIDLPLLLWCQADWGWLLQATANGDNHVVGRASSNSFQSSQELKQAGTGMLLQESCCILIQRVLYPHIRYPCSDINFFPT